MYPPGPYPVPAPSAWPYTAAPPPASNPLLDANLRYRQVLGAYERPPPSLVVTGAPLRHRYVAVPDPTKRRHDGLYFRFGLGGGFAHDSVESSGQLPSSQALFFSPDRFVGSGSTAAFVTELAAGYTVASGLVLGAGAYTATLPSLHAHMKDTRTGDYSYRVSQLAVLGPLVDWYVDDELGFHVEAAPGLATYVAGAAEPALDGPLAQAHTALGFGIAAGAGYEWWISDQWSLGLLGRVLFATTNGSDNRGVDWHHTTYAPAALLAATYQ
jgi:hypothetical protein